MVQSRALQIVEQGICSERDTRYQGTGSGSKGHHLIHVPHRSRAADHQPCQKTRARGSKWALKRRLEESISAQPALFAGKGSAAGGEW